MATRMVECVHVGGMNEQNFASKFENVKGMTKYFEWFIYKVEKMVNWLWNNWAVYLLSTRIQFENNNDMIWVFATEEVLDSDKNWIEKALLVTVGLYNNGEQMLLFAESRAAPIQI